MKKILIFLFAGVALYATSCSKDKGNYDYNVPEEPIVTNLKTAYSVLIGDTLKITPVVTYSNKAKLSYTWKISIGFIGGEKVFAGPELKTLFTYGADTYNARLTITDSTNGMKYFHDFTVSGITAFTTGATVLSKVGNSSILSFIKPDGTILSDIYKAINGKPLPDGPMQVVAMFHKYINNGSNFGYWITTSGGNDGGMLIDPNTFQAIRTLRDNFFDPPASAKADFIVSTDNGTARGIINGKLYSGAEQTAYFSPIYGYFGTGAPGDYTAYRQCPVNPAFPFYFGYDIVGKYFIGFTNFGAESYIGKNYQVVSTSVFDPKNLGLTMLELEQYSMTDGYAFGRAANDSVYELQYKMGFPGTIQIEPKIKRPFIDQNVIKATTLWQMADGPYFYFTSNDKLYWYNPSTQDLKLLATNFGGKTITMLKLIDGGSVIVAGVDGSLYYLDTGVGKQGNIIKKIDGISGSPVDITVRK